MTRFKSDRQRKAVMSRLSRAGIATGIHDDKPVEFSIDLVQAEFMNDDTDISNVWDWKSGQNLTRIMDGSQWVIANVDRYPESSIQLIKK
ncbi:hypothetical protein GQ472_01785 [archaeon]|nr:hypothetical protein [archaeon]